MPQSLHQVYVHIVLSTKKRMPFIDDQIAPHLFAYLGGICNAYDTIPIKVGGYRNHIHMLCKLSKATQWPALIEKIKSNSSGWIKKQGVQYLDFSWQAGYAIFSVTPKYVDILIRYIENQKQHHERVNFETELVKQLESDGVEYDERYLWD